MLSQDSGAPIASVSSDDDISDMGGNLVRMIRQGQSFSGHERNCVFLNTGKTQFANVSSVSGIDFDDDARAAAKVDWDFDGDIDLWFSNRNAPAVRFLSNQQVMEQQSGSPSNSHFLSLRLRGIDCNRDAIGARVEVRMKGDPRPLVRSVVAGDGYLTQSSKWIHIGLGSKSEIESLRVRWPHGTWEHFSGIVADRQWELVQNAGVANVWNKPVGRQLENDIATDGHEERQSPDPSNTATYFATRLPVPILGYEDSLRNLKSLEVTKPTLLVLWASWCQPCIGELQELIDNAARFESVGVRLLALSVDSLDHRSGDVELAKSIMERLAFPFEYGFAASSTVHKLQIVNDHLFGLQRTLPVPTSFLIDENNQLVAIYKGALDVERVLRDVDRRSVEPLHRRDLSVPFPGQWIGKPRTLRFAPLVVELARAGYLENASEYVQRVQNRFDRDTILDLVVRLGVAYYREQKVDYSKLHFQMARKIDPKTVLPEVRLGEYFEHSGRYAEAAQVYASKPSMALKTRLAWLLATCPDPKVANAQKAIAYAREMGLQSATAMDILAAAYAAEGRFDEAVVAATKAVQMANETKMRRKAEEIGKRVRNYQSGKRFMLSSRVGS